MAGDKTLRDRLRSIAARHTQSEIARRTGTWVSNVHHYLSGTRVPADFCIALVRELGVNPAWLLAGEGVPYSVDLTTTGQALPSDVQDLARALDAASRLRLAELHAGPRSRMLGEINQALESHARAQERLAAVVGPQLDHLMQLTGEALTGHVKGDAAGLPAARGLLVSLKQLLRLARNPNAELSLALTEMRIAVFESRFAEALEASRRAFLLSFSVLGPGHGKFVEYAGNYSSSLARLGYYREARVVLSTALALARAAGNDPATFAFRDVLTLSYAMQAGEIAGTYDAAQRAWARVLECTSDDQVGAAPMVAEFGLAEGRMTFDEAGKFGPETPFRQLRLLGWATWTEDAAQLRQAVRPASSGPVRAPEFVLQMRDRWKSLAELVLAALTRRTRGLWRRVNDMQEPQASGSVPLCAAFRAIRACQIARLSGEGAHARKLLAQSGKALAALPNGVDVSLLLRATHYRNALAIEGRPSRENPELRDQARRWFRTLSAAGFACFSGFGL